MKNGAGRNVRASSQKEVLRLRKEMERLEKNFGGIKEMKKMPGAVFVVDPRKEKIAIAEAKKLNIPVVAIVDTNCDPEEVDYVIPGNDDAIRAVKLIVETIANAVLEGKQGESFSQSEASKSSEEQKEPAEAIEIILDEQAEEVKEKKKTRKTTKKKSENSEEEAIVVSDNLRKRSL